MDEHNWNKDRNDTPILWLLFYSSSAVLGFHHKGQRYLNQHYHIINFKLVKIIFPFDLNFDDNRQSEKVRVRQGAKQSSSSVSEGQTRSKAV